MLLIHLGYERAGLYKSVEGDVPHGWLKDETRALCGVELKTAFTMLLFATPGGTEPDGTPYNTLAHAETFGHKKCEKCLFIASKFDYKEGK